MIFPPKRKFSWVLWLDASSPGATEVFDANDLKDVHEVMPIITSGWVLREDAKGITLGAEYCGGTEFRGITHIPAPMLVEVLTSAPPRPRKKPLAPVATSEVSS